MSESTSSANNNKSLYHATMARMDKFVPKSMLPLWNSQLGPKTIFFWAPLFKWGLVLAGVGDLRRPAEQLSVSQSASLAATGFIWSRYSLVITPRNVPLFAVNLFVGLTQVYQLYRAVDYRRRSPEGNTAADAVGTATAGTAVVAGDGKREEKKL